MTEFRLGTSADANAFADLAVFAGADLFDKLFGSRKHQVMAHVYAQPNTLCSPDLVHFLMVDDAIAGMIAVYDHQQFKARNDITNKHYANQVGWRRLQLYLWGIAMSDWLQPWEFGACEPGQLYLQFIALYADYRGQGRSKLLLRHAESLAAGRYKQLALDVGSDNVTAVGSYTKAGFTIQHTSKLMNVHRMVKTLAED